jgi:hypothetical protein
MGIDESGAVNEMALTPTGRRASAGQPSEKAPKNSEQLLNDGFGRLS